MSLRETDKSTTPLETAERRLAHMPPSEVPITGTRSALR